MNQRRPPPTMSSSGSLRASKPKRNSVILPLGAMRPIAGVEAGAGRLESPEGPVVNQTFRSGHGWESPPRSGASVAGSG